jgi:hypothetical protein
VNEKSPLFIYVCERGFVLVGRPRPQLPGDSALFVTLDDVAVVRRWGTSSGLGELASEGPKGDTVLDREPDEVQLNILCIYRRIPCNHSAWKHWGI